MGSEYVVRLAPGNEGIEYRDASGTYRFDVSRRGSEWTVLMPGSRGDAFETYHLSKEEEARIVPRITAYLTKIRWLGVFPRSYRVRIARR